MEGISQSLGQKKDFNDMFAIPRLYLSACSDATKVIRIFPIFMIIALHHYKELSQMSRDLGLKEEETLYVVEPVR
ncbi:MAG TPA: hypothetical protein VNI77_06835 [Nitrososphaera sp.]|nr:hypothetical protein [Nitrososphaera sp.]